MNATVTWLTYEFTIYQPATQWNNVSGIYIFAGLNLHNQWVPYYNAT